MIDSGPAPRALVVEDDARMATLLRRILTHHGFVVSLAADGLEAERVWTPGEFDLVVLDVMLPKRDGLELCAARRAAGDRTPVIVATALDAHATRERAMAAGADAFLTKPFAFADFLQWVHRLVKGVRDPPTASDRPAG